MGLLIFLSVVVIVFLIAVLAIYLFVVGMQLKRIADNLDDCAESVRTIRGHGEAIIPGLEHINNTGGSVAGALPLLYGHAERIIAKSAPPVAPPANGHKTAPASGRRRSRIGESVGYHPPSQ
ncbi:MAG: hypothetical protein GEV09_07020 [Pseudonocardiaceae bacterium]|nr:hypothetical protein [Pseudonocardiaceae bacterium]